MTTKKNRGRPSLEADDFDDVCDMCRRHWGMPELSIRELAFDVVNRKSLPDVDASAENDRDGPTSPKLESIAKRLQRRFANFKTKGHVEPIGAYLYREFARRRIYQPQYGERVSGPFSEALLSDHRFVAVNRSALEETANIRKIKVDDAQDLCERGLEILKEKRPKLFPSGWI